MDPKGILTNFVNEIINPTIFLLWSVGLLFFVWLFVSYFIYDTDKSDAGAKLQQKITYGVVGMFLLFSASGIVFLIKDFGGELFG